MSDSSVVIKTGSSFEYLRCPPYLASWPHKRKEAYHVTKTSWVTFRHDVRHSVSSTGCNCERQRQIVNAQRATDDKGGQLYMQRQARYDVVHEQLIGDDWPPHNETDMPQAAKHRQNEKVELQITDNKLRRVSGWFCGLAITMLLPSNQSNWTLNERMLSLKRQSSRSTSR